MWVPRRLADGSDTALCEHKNRYMDQVPHLSEKITPSSTYKHFEMRASFRKTSFINMDLLSDYQTVASIVSPYLTTKKSSWKGD